MLRTMANRHLQDELRLNAALLKRLLTSFSPKLREMLLEKARQGYLPPGGERSEATVAFADIRSFTAATADMDAAHGMALPNDYLPVVAEAAFRQGGAIDAFTGDGWLAVFGGPEPDPCQHEHAVLAALAMQQSVKDAPVNARLALPAPRSGRRVKSVISPEVFKSERTGVFHIASGRGSPSSHRHRLQLR